MELGEGAVFMVSHPTSAIAEAARTMQQSLVFIGSPFVLCGFSLLSSAMCRDTRLDHTKKWEDVCGILLR
jgi:hypothetical protein